MAKNAPFHLGQAEILPGKRMTVDLPVSVLSDHTPITMSTHVINAKSEGPVLFVSAGIHGDEVIGVEIIRRLLKSKQLKLLRGTLLAVPIVNAFGFINRSRYLPDRRDLNRSFPGGEKGPLASRLANLFLEEIVSKSDLGIDLHSAAIHRTNYPQIRVVNEDSKSRDLAAVFGAPIIMNSSAREGSLRHAAQAMGKSVLLYEAGEGLRFDEVSVRAGLAGILRIMHHLGMISHRGVSKPRAASQYCSSSKWLRAPCGGLLRIFKDNGTLVKKGERLASVSDPFGDEEQEIYALFDGIVIGRAVMPVVNEGDAVFHLARVRSFSDAENAVEDLNTQLGDDPMFDEDEII